MNYSSTVSQAFFLGPSVEGNMSVQWHGDRFMRKLEKAAQSVSSVSLTDLMTPEFMQQHTKFGSIDQMFAASKIVADGASNDDVTTALKSEAWNEFVVQNSNFGSWDEMMQAAGNERFKNAFNEQ